MTWNELVELEPKLNNLPLIAAKAGRESGGDVMLWYSEVKRRLLPLIGFCRKPPGFVGRPLPSPITLDNPDWIWNTIERERLIALESSELKPLYGSPAL